MKLNKVICCLFISIILCGCKGNGIAQNEDLISHVPFQHSKDGRWGLIDFKGNILIDEEFQNRPSAVMDGMFHVKNEDGLYEIYTADKHFKKIGSEYISVGDFHSGLAPVVEKGEPVKYINKYGDIAFELKDYKGEIITAATEFHNGKAAFKISSGNYGFIDTSGKVILPPIYEDVLIFCGAYAAVAKDGDSFFINEKGENVLKLDKKIRFWALPSDDMFPYSVEDEIAFGYMNLKGEKVIKESSKFYRAYNFVNGYAVFMNSNGEYGLIDKKGNITIRAKYQGLIQCDDLLVYGDNGKYGLLTYSGEIILRACYDKIIPFVGDNSYTYACDNEEWILIDKKGDEVNKNTYYSIYFPEKVIPQEFGTKIWSYYDYWHESDYVDLSSEAQKISSIIKNESVDKVSYRVMPGTFATTYGKEYEVSDLKNVYNMEQDILEEENFRVKLIADYTESLIVPRYKKEWRSNYWTGGYYENVLSGYSYNNISPDCLILDIGLKGKLTGRCKDFYNAIYDSFSNRKFIKLAEEEKDGLYRIFMDEKDNNIRLILNRHLNDDEITIVVRKK